MWYRYFRNRTVTIVYCFVSDRTVTVRCRVALSLNLTTIGWRCYSYFRQIRTHLPVRKKQVLSVHRKTKQQNYKINKSSGVWWETVDQWVNNLSCDGYRLYLPPSAFWDLQFCEANVCHRFLEKFTEYNVIIYVCKSWSLVFLNQLLN